MANRHGAQNGKAASLEWSAREIARRHEEAAGKPLSPVMKTAATACELAHGSKASKSAVRKG